MSDSVIPPLVTVTDNARLRGLMATPIGRRHERAMRDLVAKLNRARIVPPASMPGSIVTMNSRVACWDYESGKRHELTLVYPWDEAPRSGKISVLSPLGIDLLGALPGRALRLDGARLKIAYISYQPESRRSA